MKIQASCVYGDRFQPEENKKVVDEELDRTSCPVKGDNLIISRMNTPELVGNCGYVEDDYPNLFLPDRLWLSHFPTLAPVYPKFFWYLLISKGFKNVMSSLATGTSGSMKNITQEDLLGATVAVPPLIEQHTIANFLARKTEKIDTLIGKQQALIEKLREKRTVLVSRTVTRGLPLDAAARAGLNPNPKLKASGVEWIGEVPEHWSVTPLRYLTDMRGGATPDKNEPEFWEGVIPWVSPKDMKRPDIDDSLDHISEDALRNSSLTLLPVESVLIVVRGMILAHSFPVALTHTPVTINQDMKALLVRKQITARFLFWSLSGFAKVLVSLAEESAHGTRKIETSVLSRFSLPFPLPTEQQAIVDFLDYETEKIDRLIEKVQEAIAKLRMYRTSLITAAVTGKIDVRETA